MKCVAYDLAYAPASWDFLQWLINVKLAQPTVSKVKFVKGPNNGFRFDTLPRPTAARQAIFDHVIRPALILGGFTEGDGEEVQVPGYFIRDAVNAAKQGATIPKWNIPQWATDHAKAYLGNRKPLILTLREASYYPERNSNLPAWKEFARTCGEDVIFVRDTAKADEPIEGFETCPRASRELLFRAALMAQAKANLMVANGPIAICEYLDVPWLMFKPLMPEIPHWTAGQSRWWAKMGVPPHAQLPWSNEHQRIVWAHDDLDEINLAWKRINMPLRSKARRKVTREIEFVFHEWRKNASKYVDSLNRVETFEMWENNDDRPADVQVVAKIIEHLVDVDAALQNIKKLSRQAAWFCIELDAMRGKESWRNIIERHFTVLLLEDLANNHIAVLAAPVMKVPGVIPVAAGTEEGRWANVEANCKAVAHRVQRAYPHKRKAILACYGPTLKDNLAQLIEEAKDSNADVISVSGSHDYLIGQGIVPRFHVESDPRPHKADNINRPHPNVDYELASQVHPVVIEKLKGQRVSLWHLSDGQAARRLKDELEPHAWFVGGRANVGIATLPLKYEQGYREFSIYGMDCSFTDDGAQRWAGAHASKANGKEHDLIRVKLGDREFISSGIYLTYATCFFEVINRMPDATFRVNGDSLLQAWCRLGADVSIQQAA